jgi:hypothetical protein
MKLGNLRNEEAAREVLEQVRAAAITPRTQYFEIVSQTRDIEFTLVLVW